MESLEWLADGDDGVRVAGPSEYFNQFYDVIDDDSGWDWRSWSCFTKDEVAALDAVLQIVTTACEETPTMVSEGDLVLSGWPSRIGPIAFTTLSLMSGRGRFREDIKEEEPSLPG